MKIINPNNPFQALRVFVVIVVLLSTHITASAQETAVLEWVRRIGGATSDRGRDMAIDASGNVYTTGNFSGTVDFDPGPGVFNITATGSSKTFVSKIDVNGNFVWAKATGGSGFDSGFGIAVDASGNVYVTGGFAGTADFDPGAGTFTMTAATTGEYDIFISKLDANGNFVWAKGIIGGTWWDNPYSITLDPAGNVYVVGRVYYQGGARDFDPGPGTHLVTINWEDVFVLKLDNNGNFQWVKTIGGIEEDRGYGIALDVSGNVYTTGYFKGTVDFDPGAGTFNLTASGDWDVFISKLDASGNFVWAKAFVNTTATYYSDGTYGRKIGLDASGNVYTTGRFTGTADFDPGTGTSNLTAIGNYDIYVSKLDTDGNFVWARSMGGSSYDEGMAVTLDASANVYITGFFSQTVDFDPGAGTFNLTSAASNDDVFISKLDKDGNFKWARSMGGTSDDQAYAISLDGTGNIYSMGWFGGTGDFDPGACTLNLTSAGADDFFIQKLNQVVVAPLSITSFSPDAGATGTTVTITGTGFSTTPANNQVKFFNNLTATVTASTATTITTTVPSGVTIGGISVTVNCVTVQSPSYFCVPSAPPSSVGLIASYPFTGNANDVSGNNNNGTVIGATLTTDRFGNANGAYLFNGSSTYITVPNSASLQSPTTAISMSAWINPTGYSLVNQVFGPILTKSNSASNSFMYGMNIAPANLEASINDWTNYATTPLTPQLNTWQMVTVVMDATHVYFYLNGALIDTQSYVTNISSNTLPLEIGRDTPGFTEYFNGKIDEIQIYNRALSKCEVAAMYVPAPMPTITSFTPPSGLIGAGVTITGTNFSATPGNNSVYFNGTSAVPTASTTTSITTTVPVGATTGKITVTVLGNTATSATNFIVNTSTITITTQPGPATVCEGDIAFFTVAATGAANLVFQWQFASDSNPTNFTNVIDGTGYSDATTVALSVNSAGSFGAGRYRCKIDGDLASTVFSNDAELTINLTPLAPTTTGALGCAPLSTTLNASGGTPGNYRWYATASGGTAIPGENSSSFNTTTLAATTTYFVSILSGSCESDRVPVVATVTGSCSQLPVIADQSLATQIGGIITLDLVPLITTANNNLDTTSIHITESPSSGANATIENGLLTIDYSGLAFAGPDAVTIQACDKNSNCAAQEFTIEVAGDIEVYNALSPHGANPVFVIRYIDLLPDTKNNEVTIFDRWQSEVWRGTNYDNSTVVFAGSSAQGKELPSGTYYYKILFGSGRKSRTGFISLKR